MPQHNKQCPEVMLAYQEISGPMHGLYQGLSHSKPPLRQSLTNISKAVDKFHFINSENK